ncbi:hypothetical protein ACFPIF_07625 [Brevundimonas faecalis]|uniref:hypothetical protein n=1 Tax=Brevundimonas faecalis TaxID=947378 RepID=UPI0036075C5A
MTRLLAFLTATALLPAVLSAPAQAQAWRNPSRPGSAARDPISAIADQHRFEMERLRALADQREALARQQRLQTQLTLQRLEAARVPAPSPPPQTAYARPFDVAPVASAVGPTRLDATQNGLAEIDAWLDRRPH